jgi:hypothetical protein
MHAKTDTDKQTDTQREKDKNRQQGDLMSLFYFKLREAHEKFTLKK